MRALIVFVVLISVCGVARAGDAPDLAGANVVAHELVSNLQTAFENAMQGKMISDDDKDFVPRALKLPIKDAQNLILALKSESLFLSYWDDVFAQLNEKSARTGREIKTEQHDWQDNKEYYYWLDRGDICEMDFAKKQACDYPDGFEEFAVILQETKTDDVQYIYQKLTVYWDDASQNKHNILQFEIASDNYHGAGHLTYGLDVCVTGEEMEYDEYYAWQNQLAQDIRNGMMTKVSRRENRKYKDSPFGKMEWKGGDSREWKSLEMIPGSKVVRLCIDANMNYTKN